MVPGFDQDAAVLTPLIRALSEFPLEVRQSPRDLTHQWYLSYNTESCRRLLSVF